MTWEHVGDPRVVSHWRSCFEAASRQFTVEDRSIPDVRETMGHRLRPPGGSTGGHFTHGISGVSASAVCKPSSVPIDAEAPSGDGHPSQAAGRPTAHAADPRAGQRASPPAGRPARVTPSYLALLRVEFARFTPPPTRGSATASSLWHWSSSRDGRVLPATLRCGARTFLTPTDAGHPDRCRATIRPAR